MAHLLRRPRAVLAAIMTAALALAGCGTADDTAAPEGAITAATAYATTNYHPSTTSSALAQATNWHVVEGLYDLDMSTYTPHKALAAVDEPIALSDVSYRIPLRAGATFSDGSPVTATDVVTSFQRTMADGNIFAAMLDFVADVSADGTDAVRLTLSYPFGQLRERLAIVRIVPAAVSDEQLTAQPIGSGPYKYASITDAEIHAVPNELYNGDYPATAPELIWNVLVDDTARTTAAQSGAVDVVENVPADNAALLEKAGLVVAEKPGFNLPFLIFNTNKAPFNDKRVRQAFHYAIDTQRLIYNNMSEKAEEATSFLPATHPNYHRATTQFGYDPERARQLLAEAGATDLTITLLTTDHTWIESLAPQIKNNLEAVGIKTNIQSQASASLYADNLDTEGATYDVALAPGDPSAFGQDPALLINWWYGDNVWTHKRSFFKESDPAGFKKIRSVLDRAVRLSGEQQQAAWDEAQDLIAEYAVTYPLFHRTMLTAYNPETVADFTPISTTGLYLIGARPIDESEES